MRKCQIPNATRVDQRLALFEIEALGVQADCATGPPPATHATAIAPRKHAAVKRRVDCAWSARRSAVASGGPAHHQYDACGCIRVRAAPAATCAHVRLAPDDSALEGHHSLSIRACAGPGQDPNLHGAGAVQPWGGRLALVLPIENAMEDPTIFPKLLSVTMVIVSAVCTAGQLYKKREGVCGRCPTH